jgi:hypothetical protein
VTKHQPTAFLLAQGAGEEAIQLSLDTMSDGALLLRAAEVQSTADDIRDQLQAEMLAVAPRGREWRGRAHRARKFYLAEGRALNAEMIRRQAEAKRHTKLAIADLGARAQQGQQALFVDYMRRSVGREEFTALWVRVRDMFPDDPAWLNGKGAGA